MSISRRYVVEVNECRIFATKMGEPWWHDFSRAQEERIVRVVMSVAGDLVHVDCDDKPHATWLRDHMVRYGGLPSSAVKTRCV